MWEQTLFVVFGLIIPFGPAVYVLVRWNASPEKISPDMVKAVLAWTALMMLIKVHNISEREGDLRRVCHQLETHLARELRDADTARDSVGEECHPEDYEPPERDQ